MNIGEAIRGIVPTGDPLLDKRLEDIALGIEMQLESHQRESLGEMSSLGSDLLTIWRTMRMFRQDIEALREENQRLRQTLEQVHQHEKRQDEVIMLIQDTLEQQAPRG